MHFKVQILNYPQFNSKINISHRQRNKFEYENESAYRLST